MKFAVSGAQLAAKLPSDRARPSPEASPPEELWLRNHRLSLAAALVAMLMLGALVMIPHAQRQPRASTAAQTPTPAEAASPSPADARSAAEAPIAQPAEVAATTAASPIAPAPAPTLAPSRPDLSGTWRGEYVDASGKALLRVVSLSISRVYDDGGIEGTLQYAAASGEGECRLHRQGSSYSAGARRLQLSPEGCSPHYPRELGVPLDFDGVSPRANTLRDGRIEAPTGERISVRLRRVSGV